MIQLLNKLLGRKPKMSREQVMRVFKRRYVSFKDLLQSNTDLANIMANLEQQLHDGSLITTSQVRAEATKAVFHTMRMVSSLNAISKDAYSPLNTVVADINTRIMGELDQKAESCQCAFTLPLSEVDARHADHVGGKCANLGEIANVVGLPVPRGFAVTTSAYSAYLHSPEVLEEVRKLLRHVQLADPASIQQVSEAIQSLLQQLPLPPTVEAALYQAWDETFGPESEDAPPIVASLRSSAVDEDGHHSFAGQYRTVLGLRRDTLVPSFCAVAASLFSPRAISYRLSHGYLFEQSLMAMVCLEMVDAVAAGVAFSRHPVDLKADCVLINGLWGLGELVVDGAASPDTWEVAREEQHILHRNIAHKPRHLQLAPPASSGAAPSLDTLIHSLEVPAESRDRACLSDAQAAEVARLTLQLEQHYHRPQDVEWALNAQGTIILLQSRPMRMADGRVYSGPPPPRIEGAELLFEGADIAAAGVACGPVVLADPDDDLTAFPQGGVLVTRHSSPHMVVVMDRAAAWDIW